MNTLSSSRKAGVIAVALALFASLTPAGAATTAVVSPGITAQASAATLTGTVKDGAGAPVTGAHVVVTGGTSQDTTTDASGNFSVSVPPGLYRVSIDKGGYNGVSLSDITAAAGTTTPVSVTMTQVSLESLSTIGRVTTTSRGSAINAGPAQSSTITAQQFADLQAPQINDVLQRVPGLTIQQMGSQQDRSIVVGGFQPYETQVLVDGHPLAQGQYGVWVSTYFPSFLIGSAEIQTGPGNTTPFANLAVGGTANLLTPGYTKKTHTSITQGFDNYGSQYTTFLGTGSFGNLSYVIDLGTAGLNTPLTGKNLCISNPDFTNPSPGFATLQGCGPADGNFFNKGEVFKLKYDFTPKISFEAGFVGAWGGFSPQGTAWGSALGPQHIENCQFAGPVCSVPNAPQIGTTINGYAWYTGSSIYNNQELFDGQLRVGIGSGTLLVRPYVGNIQPEEISDVGSEGFQKLYSAPGQFGGLTPGQPVPAGYVAPPNSAQAACLGSFGALANPAGLVVAVNNQFQCFGNPYTTYEIDKLYGMTTSYIQPLGSNGDFLDLTYDFHGQSTFAYIDQPAFVSVPFTTTRYSTFSLTGSFAVTPQLTTNIGLYDTLWSVNGTQLADPSNTTSTATTSLNRTISHFDPHLAFVFRADPATSIRAAVGTSTTFPFAGQVSGLAAYQGPAQSLGAPFADGGTLTEKNPALNPETAIAYTVGADHRMKGGAVVGLDLNETIVHGVFQQLTTAVPVAGCTPLYLNTPCLEGIYTPQNVAKLDQKSVTLKYEYAPVKGFGFNLHASATSAILSGLTPNLFTPNSTVGSAPANNVQICGPGTTVGAATCIPYLQGYGQFTYAGGEGLFLGLGVQYLGKNNAYFQPPFALVDLTARKAVGKHLDVSLGVQNLLNTNNYGQYLPIPGAGTTLVSNTTNSTFSNIQQVSFPTSLVPAPPRYVRVALTLHD
jgi:outer membrane receptor protein involved in Fe transport